MDSTSDVMKVKNQCSNMNKTVYLELQGSRQGVISSKSVMKSVDSGCSQVTISTDKEGTGSCSKMSVTNNGRVTDSLTYASIASDKRKELRATPSVYLGEREI